MSTPQNLFGDDIATDSAIVLLRRIVKLMESSGNNDIANRQRITLDAITAGTTLPAVTTVTTVSTVTNLGTIAGYDHRQWQDQTRTAYNTGIRSQLSFT